MGNQGTSSPSVDTRDAAELMTPSERGRPETSKPHKNHKKTSVELTQDVCWSQKHVGHVKRFTFLLETSKLKTTTEPSALTVGGPKAKGHTEGRGLERRGNYVTLGEDRCVFLMSHSCPGPSEDQSRGGLTPPQATKPTLAPLIFTLP